jgi:polar amino acid transport system substrate-binding protein
MTSGRCGRRPPPSISEANAAIERWNRIDFERAARDARAVARNSVDAMNKKRPFQRLMLLVSVWAGAVLSVAAQSELRVGVTPNAPPMVYKEGGKVVGMESDFAETLGAALGRPIKFVEVNWDDQIPALLDGKTDIIMSSMSITRARQFRIAFSKPYLQVGQMALVRRDDAYRYALGFPFQLQGVIGVKKGTTGDFLAQMEFPKTKRKEFKSGEEGARALIKKKIDLYLGDSPMIWWLASVNEENGLTAVPILLSEENLAWGVRKTDAPLLEAVNQSLDQMAKNGRLKQIIRKWLPNAK